MKTNLISKEGNEVKFTMIFDADEFENAVVEVYKKNKDRFTIDGFRKGKAPRKMIENHYGEGIFWDDAINDLLQVNYPKVLDELELDVVDAPRLELGEIETGKNLEITAKVAVMPEIEVKDYFGVEVEGIDSTIKDEEVEEELKRVQKSQSRLETVEGRKTEEGDTVVFDFKGSVDGVEFQGGSAENFELTLGSGQFIPGFEEQLVGKDSGEEVDVIVTFPEEYHAEDLAGKEALFKCKLHEIKKEILPEIDDDLASDVSEFETLEEYKADLRVKLQKNADAQAEQIIKDSIIQKVYDTNKFDIPPALVEDEIDRMLQEMDQQLSYQGLSLQKYMEFLGQSVADLREQARGDAEQRVGTRNIIKAIVEKENIEVSDEEIKKEIEMMAEQYQTTAEEVEKMIGEENKKYFVNDVKTKKAIDVMYSKAVILPPAEKKEEAAEEASEDKAE